MIEQLKTFDNNVLAIEVIDGFTEEDEKLCRKFFELKRKKGFKQINILVKLDEIKISNSSTKAFFEDIIWLLRNYKEPGDNKTKSSSLLDIEISLAAPWQEIKGPGT